MPISIYGLWFMTFIMERYIDYKIKPFWTILISLKSKNFDNDRNNRITTNTAGFEKVRKGGFILIAENPTIEYELQDDCNLEQIGGIFNTINYGLVFRPGIARNVLIHYFVRSSLWNEVFWDKINKIYCVYIYTNGSCLLSLKQNGPTICSPRIIAGVAGEELSLCILYPTGEARIVHRLKQNFIFSLGHLGLLIVFVNDRFLFCFQKRSFRFRKKTIVFKNDPLVLNF